MIKQDILNELKATGDYVSGETLSEKLGISRTAVWKHINSLKKDGYDILSVTNKGYRLLQSDVLNAEEIQSWLTTEYFGRNAVCVHETDSTNDLAKRESSMPEGTVFTADIQTAGKGRRGKSWVSGNGDGLWMSILIKPDIMPQQLSGITLVTGLAVAKALIEITGAEVLIKWPNDIVLERKKLCGILCEMSAEINAINYAVCGIGINLNKSVFDGEIGDVACSVMSVTGKKTNRGEVCAKVLNHFEPLYSQYLSEGIESIIGEYKKYCVTIGKTVNIVKGKEVIKAKAVDLNTSGELLIETENGRETVSSGEVSVRGLFGYI